MKLTNSKSQTNSLVTSGTNYTRPNSTQTMPNSTEPVAPTETSTIPFIETPVKAASAPAFIQVGKTYNCSYPGLSSDSVKVTKIDSNSGWIEDVSGKMV